jgi:hypothetical protein
MLEGPATKYEVRDYLQNKYCDNLIKLSQYLEIDDWPGRMNLHKL